MATLTREEEERTGDEAASSTVARLWRHRPRPLGWFSRGLLQVGEMTWFSIAVLQRAVRPWKFWGELRDQMYLMLRRSWLPMIVSSVAFGYTAGLAATTLLVLLGAPERGGGILFFGTVREYANWVTFVLVAGVAGTAATAELGARKVRDELDALEVLGVDPLRTIVAPRVAAFGIMTPILFVAVIVFGLVGCTIGAVVIGKAGMAAFLASFWSNSTPGELLANLLKNLIAGLIVGVVCCYKGMRASGGAVGVGRAVNQAVVICVAVLFILAGVFNAILLGMFPSMQTLK